MAAAALACAGCLALLTTGCGRTEATLATAPPPPEVKVAKPTAREIVDYFQFPGQTAAVGEVEIRARVTGYIVKVNFEDGQQVKKGDLLFEIDPRPYQAALEQAKGELARLKAMEVKAKTNVGRSEGLLPSGAVSRDAYEQHVENLAIVRASIQAAEAAIRNAELNLEFTKVVSPIDGRVSRRRITEGNLVQTGTDDAMILTTVVTTEPLYVYFNIEEPVLLKYLASLWQAEGKSLLSRIKELAIPVEIGLDTEEGFPHVGRLDFVDNRVDRGTGTIQARGVFEKPDPSLAPGLYVRVRIPFGKPRPALLVPDRAIGTDMTQKYLLAVNAKNGVERRLVTASSLHEGLRVIESGIGPDDRIIVDGLQRAGEELRRARENARVHPTEFSPTDDGGEKAAEDVKSKADK
jgi:RND family efflux transporter MFP subunit